MLIEVNPPHAYKDLQGFQRAPQLGRYWALQWGLGGHSDKSSSSCHEYRWSPLDHHRKLPPWMHQR